MAHSFNEINWDEICDLLMSWDSIVDLGYECLRVTLYPPFVYNILYIVFAVFIAFILLFRSLAPGLSPLPQLSCFNSWHMYTLLRQRRLRWLGHVCRMEDGRISKDLLYGELAEGKRNTGRPQLRFRDVCKRDMKAPQMDPDNWEALAADRPSWRSSLMRQLKTGEENLTKAAMEKRARRKATLLTNNPDSNSTHKCNIYGRVCGSRIGLHSHMRRCRQ